MSTYRILSAAVLVGLMQLGGGRPASVQAQPPAEAKTERKPLKADTDWKNTGPKHGHWCRVEASLNWGKIPTLIGTIQTEAHSTKGFVGGGYVDLLDKKGNILTRVVVPSVGQDPETFPFFASPRTVHYSVTFDPANVDHAAILAKVDSVRATACNGDEPDFLKKLKETAKDAYEVYQAIQGK